MRGQAACLEMGSLLGRLSRAKGEVVPTPVEFLRDATGEGRTEFSLGQLECPTIGAVGLLVRSQRVGGRRGETVPGPNAGTADGEH